MFSSNGSQALNLLSNGVFTHYWVEPEDYAQSSEGLVTSDRTDVTQYHTPNTRIQSDDPAGALGHWTLSGEGYVDIGTTYLSRDGGNMAVLTLAEELTTTSTLTCEEGTKLTARDSAGEISLTISQDLTDRWGVAPKMGLGFSGMKIHGDPIVDVVVTGSTGTIWTDRFTANMFGSYRRITQLLTGTNRVTAISFTVTGVPGVSIGLTGITLVNGSTSHALNYSPSLADMSLPKGLVFLSQGDAPLPGFYALPGDYAALIGPNHGPTYGTTTHTHASASNVGGSGLATRNFAVYHQYPAGIPFTPNPGERPLVSLNVGHTHAVEAHTSASGTTQYQFCYRV